MLNPPQTQTQTQAPDAPVDSEQRPLDFEAEMAALVAETPPVYRPLLLEATKAFAAVMQTEGIDAAKKAFETVYRAGAAALLQARMEQAVSSAEAEGEGGRTDG